MAKKKVQKHTRRANNEGSVFQRKDGRWGGALTIGYDENGKVIRKTIYGKSQAEVVKKLSEISGRVKSNSYELMESKDLEHLMFEYLMTFKKSSVTPRTFEGSIRNFKLHIAPHIGKMKVYEIDNYTIQKLVNILLDQGYSVDTAKKCKHLLNQFFEYAIDNKWVLINPTLKVKIKGRRNVYEVDTQEKYKALPPEIRDRFLQVLNKDEANFIKPLCICLMFAGLRIGEAIALKWQNIDFNNKTIKVERAITQIPKFDEQGNIKDRVTVVGDTKTACSVREIPVTDIVIETLKEWKEKQEIRQQTNPEVTANLTSPTSFVFANDDGSYRTYSGCRVIFDRWKKRNGFKKYAIHFHGLRHTFSNMLFEMNENPKVIQQLLGHRDVKTTITVYNSVNSDYVREATDRLNTRIQEHNIEKEIEEQEKANEITTITTENEYTKNVEIPTPQNVEEVNELSAVSEMPNQEDDKDELTDEEIDRMIRALERKKKRKEKDFEM